jgi:hypothetical protein
MASPSLFFAFLLARWVLPRFLLGWWGSLASFHWLCLVHVQIEAVWLVLGARGDVSRRVITCIGWDGFIEAVLLVCGGPSHYWDIVFVFINSFLLFFFINFFIEKSYKFWFTFILGCNINNKILNKSWNNIAITLLTLKSRR